MKRYRRNELQAREGIDTFVFFSSSFIKCYHVEMSYKPERALTPIIFEDNLVFFTHRRNELQAREGIDTRHCGITLISFDHDVEMSYKPERALTQFT